VTVTVSDGRGRGVRAPGLGEWLARIAPASAQGELAVALVSDARIRNLNRTYRRKDNATDVLSFDAGRSDMPATVHTLGDIVIATGVARRQAREAGHSYSAELRVLALHGLLHLLGYDHETPAGRRRMARLERRLRMKGGLGAGLIERSDAPAGRRGRRAARPRRGTTR
jgi:probable rRNA maturation factor